MKRKSSLMKRMRKGFTLIELLLAIGILAILAAVVVLILNPLELIRQSRDVKRLTELKTLDRAFHFAQSAAASQGTTVDLDGPNFSNDSCEGQANQRIFVSVPSGNGETPPTPPTGWTWAQVTSDNLYKTDGNGWVPVNFQLYPQSGIASVLPTLPVDPTNTFASGLYFTYVCGSYELDAKLESDKYKEKSASTDEGDDTTLFEIGSDLLITPARPAVSSSASQAPTISSISPATGTNDAVIAITSIAGQNFQIGATVKLTKTLQADISGTSFTSVSGTALVGGSFNIQGAATGLWNVVVTNPSGEAGTLANGFAIDNPPPPSSPTVTSINPSSRGQGATSQAVTITGTNFTNPATISLGGTGITIASTTYVTSTQLDATLTLLSSAATGTRTITVTNSDTTQGTCVGCFTVTAAPSVSTVNPASVVQGSNSVPLTVSGANFVSGASALVSGSEVAVNSTTFDSASQLTVTVTVNSGAATGMRSITVTNPDAGVGTGSNVLTITAASASTTKTFTFDTGLESFVSSSCASTSCIRITSDGSPGTGSLEERLTAQNTNNTWQWELSGITWESLGVPAGATVTTVNGSYKHRVASSTNMNITTTNSGALTIRDSTGSSILATLESALTYASATTTAWATRDATGAVSPTSGQASNTSIRVRLAGGIRTTNSAGSNVGLRQDQIILIITYTPQ